MDNIVSVSDLSDVQVMMNLRMQMCQKFKFTGDKFYGADINDARCYQQMFDNLEIKWKITLEQSMKSKTLQWVLVVYPLQGYTDPVSFYDLVEILGKPSIDTNLDDKVNVEC